MNNTCEDNCHCFSKCSLRCETMGEIDELTSLLGIVKNNFAESFNIIHNIIHNIQKDLFKVNAELATKTIIINEQMVTDIENKCNDIKKSINNMPTDFIIPGGRTAYIDYARTIARRCERKIIKLYKEKEIDNKFLLKWINKLSYYLWLVARKEDEKCY